jgi:hypothetical protein
VTARNKVAYARGQAIRKAISDFLLEDARLHPFARRPSWREIQTHLRTRSYYIERSAICHHVQQLELEAELEELRRSAADVLPENEAA